MSEPIESSSTTPVPPTRADTVPTDRPRRRRRHNSRSGRRHRDLTPEEDNRLRQRQAIAKILPSILAVSGGLCWLAGIWNVDEYQHHRGLIRTGQAFLAVGGSVLAFFLLREWIPKLITARKERKLRRASGVETTASHRRSRRHRHRSSKPSGVRVK